MNRPTTKCRGGQERQAVPVRHAAVKGGDGHEQHQRIHGQQIAGEQRAAQHAEEQGIRRAAAERCAAGRQVAIVARSWPSASGAGIEQQRGEGHQHRHKQVHVRGEVQDAMAEGGQNAQRREVGLGVVAQKLRDCRRESRSSRSDRRTSRPAAERSSQSQAASRQSRRALAGASSRKPPQCSPRPE